MRHLQDRPIAAVWPPADIRLTLSAWLQEAKPSDTLKLVETTTITLGQIKLQMDAAVAAAPLDIDQNSINVDAPSVQDEVLIRSIASLVRADQIRQNLIGDRQQ